MTNTFEERRFVYQILCAKCKKQACARSTDCNSFDAAVRTYRVMHDSIMTVNRAKQLYEEAEEIMFQLVAGKEYE